MRPSVFAFTGKALDLTTTVVGLSLGYSEMNLFGVSPFAIILSLGLYPILLDLLELASDRWLGGRWKRLFFIPGFVAWVPVAWNLWVITGGARAFLEVVGK